MILFIKTVKVELWKDHLDLISLSESQKRNQLRREKFPRKGIPMLVYYLNCQLFQTLWFQHHMEYIVTNFIGVIMALCITKYNNIIAEACCIQSP